MNELNQLVDSYIDLERSVQILMTQLFNETCGLCTACCCRADICEEATESAFLRRLLKRSGHSIHEMDDRFGWLAQNGCALEYGRPPICYAYFCDELLARLPNEETRWVTQVLGRMMFHIGDQAVEGAHLVDVMSDDGLTQVDVAQCMDRIEQAHLIFNHIQHFIETGRISESGRTLMQTIPLDEL